MLLYIMFRFALSFLLSYLFVAAQAMPMQTTVVKGKIINGAHQYVSLRFFNDFVSLEEAEFKLPLNADLGFTFEFELDKAVPMQLIYGSTEFPLFIEPGNDLYVEIDASQLLYGTPVFKSSGNAAAHNLYLHEKKQVLHRLSNRNLLRNMRRLEPAVFKGYLDKWEAKQQRLFRANAADFSPAFKAYAQTDLQYWKAYQLMRYRWERASATGQVGPLPMPQVFKSYLDSLKLSEDAALNNLHYIYFLDQYLEYQEEKWKKQGNERRVLFRNDAARQFLSGKSMYYVLANELYMKTKRLSADQLEGEVERFLADCPHEDLKKAVKEAFSELFVLARGRKAPNFHLRNFEGDLVSLRDFQGKVVYLDFWATWCFPCLQEMKSGKRLREKLAGEEVVFLYISLDQNPWKWEEFLTRHNYTQGHLHAAGGYKSDIARLYNIRNVPRFVLIDRQGRIAEPQALPPSSERAFDQIWELLQAKD